MASVILDSTGLLSFASVSFPAGVKFVSARGNLLINLVGLPSTVQVLDVSDNKTLTSLQGISDCKQLIANNCGLTALTYVPSSLIVLEANYNAITDCTPLAACTALNHLQLDYNMIASLSGVPVQCKWLSIEGNLLTDLTNCPSGLVKASFRNNTLISNSHIASLPTGGSLTSLDLFGTAVTNYADVPLSVKDLIVASNAGISTINTTISQIRTAGQLYKDSLQNATIVSSNATTDIVSSNEHFKCAIPFSIGTVAGTKIFQNSWTQVAPIIPYLGGFADAKNPVLHITTSLKAVASLDVRVVVSDVSPYESLISNAVIADAATLTHIFTLTRAPTNNCHVELQARLGSGVSGSENAKYALVYAAVLYF